MNVSIRNIMLPSDFGPLADIARDYADALADRFHAKLHLVHIIPFSQMSSHPISAWVTYENELNLKVEIANQRLQKEASQCHLEPGRVTYSTLIGFEVEQILKYAKDHEIDVMVLGTHGRQGMSHFLLGSVAEKLVRMSQCPVLTVHSGDCKILPNNQAAPATTAPA